MQLSTALRVLAVLSASASALAAPTDITLSETFTNLDAAPGTVERRARSVGVYLCNDRDFSGYCVHIVQPVNDCIRLGSDLNDKVSSVGPDKNAGSCRFFNDYNCAGTEPYRDISYPGSPDLSQMPNANDAISSYKCSG